MSSPVKHTQGSSTYTVASVLKDGTNLTNHTGTINNDIAKNITWVDGYDGAAPVDTALPITNLSEYWIYTYAASGGTRSSWVQKFSAGAIPNADGFIFKISCLLCSKICSHCSVMSVESVTNC